VLTVQHAINEGTTFTYISASTEVRLHSNRSLLITLPVDVDGHFV